MCENRNGVPFMPFLSLSALQRDIRKGVAASKRNGDLLPDPRAQKSKRYINAEVFETLEIPLTEEE